MRLGGKAGGATAVGKPGFKHNRMRLELPPGRPAPPRVASSLYPLLDLI